MKYTENLGLNLPSDSDLFDIEDFNWNAEKIDSTIQELIDNSGTSDIPVAVKAKAAAVPLSLVGKFTEVHETSPIKLLRSTGTQCINTKWTPSCRNYKYIARVSNATIIDGASKGIIIGGCIVSGANQSSGCAWMESGWNIRLCIANTADYDQIPMITDPSIIELTVDEYNASLVVTNEITGETWTSAGSYRSNFDVTTVPCFLFAGSESNYFSATTLYYFKIYENGVLVRDMVPMLIDGAPGMYDSVNDGYYLNAGSGVFEYEEE